MGEIYEDVLREEPITQKGKKYDFWQDRLFDSAGFIMPMTQGKVFVTTDKKGKSKADSDILEEKDVFDVVISAGNFFTCDRQEDAEILSLLAQINERLKRVEDAVRVPPTKILKKK